MTGAQGDPADGRLARALARIDRANAADPRRVPTPGGELARELVYSQRMSAALERLEPDASEALRLAVRAQHLCRWRLPRTEFPDGRSGYLRWRRECAELHARLAAELLRQEGYDQTTIERVGDLVRKRNLGSDPEAMLLEDAACLVFLEHELGDFARRHDERKLVAILARTWRKMSPRGRSVALALELPETSRRLVERALERDLG